jgi:signal transduction histidine kinase
MGRNRDAVITATAVAWAAAIEITGAARQNHALEMLAFISAAILALTAYLLKADPEQARTKRLLWSAAFLTPLGDIGDALGSGGAVTGPLGQPISSWADQLGHAASRWSAVPLAAVVLTYPGRRLERRWHAWLLGAIVIVFVVAPIAEALSYSRHSFDFSRMPFWVTLIPGGEAVRVPLATVFFSGGALVALLGVVAVIGRWRSASGPARPAVRSMGIIGGLLGASLAAEQITGQLGSHGLDILSDSWQLMTVAVTLAAVAFAPLLLLLEALRRRVDQVRVLDDLLAAGGEALSVRQALRRALADPALALAFSVDGQWIDACQDSAGTWAAGTPAPGRVRQTIKAADGSSLALLDLTEAASADPALRRTVLHAATVVFDNARLQVERVERLRQLASSQARIVEAGLEERRRVERDLHDGAQQQFLTVAATLARATLATDEPTLHTAVDDARAQLGAALAELRRLARGIHPAVLTQGGLAAALPTLADAAPLELIVDVPADLRSRRLPAAVESTAWFIAAEGVANAVKHAGCTQVCVSLRIKMSTAAEHLVLRVSDNGTGGAVISQEGGLAGLLDRTKALGGSLCVNSSSGAGTTVEAVLPCAW